MFGSLTDLPLFANFHEALNYYNKTKGVRGRAHIRPLKTNRRSPDAYKIDVIKDFWGTVVAVECWLYRTPVLVYWKDRLEINGFNSNTTNNFINEIAPHWLQAATQNHNQRFYIRGEGVFLAGSGKVVVNVDDRYMPINGGVHAAKLNEVTLNKHKAAQARKSVKDVVELAKVTSKLDGYWQGLSESDEVSDDATLMRLKYVLKCGCYRALEFSYGLQHVFNGSGWHKYTADLIPYFKQYLYTQQYREQGCYDRTPAPYGVIPNKYEVA